MPAFATVEFSVLERLRQFDTPTICNVLELFDCRPRTAGYMDGRIQACYPKLPPMVGYACTATFRAGDPPRAGDVYAGLGKQVEAIAAMPGPAIVVFQDLDDPMTSATFGEVMCTTYKAFGCSGLITTGAGRDLDQVEVLDFQDCRVTDEFPSRLKIAAVVRRLRPTLVLAPYWDLQR